MQINTFQMTKKEFVSKIINALKLNNKDEHISRRFVLSVAESISKTLISQKLLDRTITHDNNLYTAIPCFEFEQVEVKKCSLIEFRMCNVLMKSKKPLPEPIFSRLGASIKDIVSLDGNYRFVFLDKGQYQRNKKRQHSIKGEVYIYLDSDMHLYVPDEEIYSVDLTLLTMKTEDVQNCSTCSKEKCRSNWDSDFVIVDKLADTVYNQTLQLIGVGRGIRADQNPNNQEGS